MVPRDRQPLEQLRARYADAVREVYDLNDPRSFTENRPSDKPRHVFDTEDGLRLIVSRESWPEGKRGIHLSASFEKGSRVEADLCLAPRPVDAFRSRAFNLWRYLAGRHPLELRREEACFQGLSEGKGIPHWFIPDKEES